MASFFERLQKYSRLYDNNAPAYLRTHPLTTERIADMQNRAANLSHKQVTDSMTFQLMRTKLRVLNQIPTAAITEYTDAIHDKRYSSLTSVQYGLTLALMQAQHYNEAEAAYNKLVNLEIKNPIIDSLGAKIKQNSGDIAGALQRYREARKRWPNYRPLVYNYADAMIKAGQPDEAIKLMTELITLYPDDYHLYQLQSRGFAQQGKDFLRHYAQAEAYAHQGNLTAAIEQLQIALKTHDGDFYQMSIAEARLKQLIVQDKIDKKPS